VRQYHDAGYEIAVISNQGGVQKKLAGKMAQMVKARAAAIALELGVPCSVLMCPARDVCDFRKPGTGMWDLFEREVRPSGAPKIDRGQSLYVGDAAGRPGDHAGKGADSDRAFAAAVGLRFMTPEECFGPQGAPKGKVAISPKAMKEGRATLAAAGAGNDEAAGPNGPLLAAISGVSAKIFALVKNKPDCLPGADGAMKWRFKAVAYTKAATAIAGAFGGMRITTDNLKEVAKLPGVGKSTLDKLKEFLTTGHIALMDELEGYEAAGPAAVGAVPAHVQQQQAAAAAFM
jgi:bifunctional polynucleotide phosphatase/kinase